MSDPTLDFLATVGWGDAVITPLAGDASNRRYDRVTRGPQTAVLMHAPTEKGEALAPFLSVAGWLDRNGITVPGILAQDQVLGLALIEDLGDALFARIAKSHPYIEAGIYTEAARTLAHFQAKPAPADMPKYDPGLMTDFASLGFQWYRDQGSGAPLSTKDKEFLNQLHDALADMPGPSVFVHRDYHAENLFWLPERSGIKRVGVIDFQDAMTGPRAYDLVSLIEDARRDLGPGIGDTTWRAYLDASGADEMPIRHAFRLLSIQRNLRVLCVFARLSLAYGKPHYVDLIPRTWGYLQATLAHPEMSDLARALEPLLPVPTENLLQELKDKCATVALL